MQAPRTRRSFLHLSALAAVPLATERSASAASSEVPSNRKLKVVCVGGHPDDPESGCGGALIRYAQAGHSVSVIYLTCGERGIRDKGLDEAAKIRTAESEAACKLMGAQPVFFGQIDGATEFTRSHVDAMTKLLRAQQPDIILTHWPIDTHMDHQVASMLAIRAHMALGQRPRLYFFEVDAGSQTQGFLPNTYIDISGVLEKKKAALFAHESQDGRGIWREHHGIMASWRGREAGVAAAEAFVALSRDTKSATLPGF
jgi:LmbE family N-acetylglucosaminyl deacetylase